MRGAHEFALALFSLSEELRITESVLSDLKDSKRALLDNPEYIKLCDTPSIAKSEKLSLIDRAFSPVDETVRNLLMILSEKHSVYIFPEIVKEFIALYNESRNICEAEAISAVALSAEELSAIEKKLMQMTGKSIIMKNTIDPAVLGGIKLRYMGKQLDGTLRARLSAIENSLKNTIL